MSNKSLVKNIWIRGNERLIYSIACLIVTFVILNHVVIIHIIPVLLYQIPRYCRPFNGSIQSFKEVNGSHGVGL